MGGWNGQEPLSVDVTADTALEDYVGLSERASNDRSNVVIVH